MIILGGNDMKGIVDNKKKILLIASLVVFAFACIVAGLITMGNKSQNRIVNTISENSNQLLERNGEGTAISNNTYNIKVIDVDTANKIVLNRQAGYSVNRRSWIRRRKVN